MIVGYGRVGRRIGAALRENGVPFVVAEQNREIVEDLRRHRLHAVSGDGTDATVLAQAHVARARILVIATPETTLVRRMIENARALNPDIEIVVRTHSEAAAALLERERAGAVFMGEHELARSMARHVLERVSPAPAAQRTAI